MKKILCLGFIILISSCKSPPRRIVKDPPMPSINKVAVRESISKPTVTTFTNSGFRFTNIVDLGSQVKLMWKNSTNPVMVQYSTILPHFWNNIGNPTIALERTLPKDTKQKYFRLQDKWPTVTLHTDNNPHRLTIQTIDVLPTDYIEVLKLKQLFTDDDQFPSDAQWNAAPYSQTKGTVGVVLPESEYYFDDLTVPTPGQTLHYFPTAHTHNGKTIELNKPFFTRQVPGTFRFVTTFGNSVNFQHTRVHAMAIDPFNDDIVVTGQMDGVVDFGTGNLGGNYTSIFVAKFTKAGQIIWAFNYGQGANNPTAIVIDSTRVITICGVHYNPINFGGDTLPHNAGSGDIFIVQFDSDGIYLRDATYGSLEDDKPWRLALSGPYVYMVGQWGRQALARATTINFGGSDLIHDPNDFNADVFVVKLIRSDLSHVWSKSFSGTANVINDAAKCITVGPDGHPVVGGSFGGTINFGGTSSPLVSTGNFNDYDMFVVKLNSATGVGIWANKYGGAALSEDEVLAIVTDSLGNIVLTGVTAGNINMGGNLLVSAGRDFVLAKYTSGGVHIWSQNFLQSAPLNTGRFNALAVDSLNNIYAVGVVQGAVSLGGDILISVGPNVCVAKYDSNGNCLWSQVFVVGDASDEGTAIAVNINTVFLAGFFNLAVNFSNPPSSQASKTSSGGYDGFIAGYIR